MDLFWAPAPRSASLCGCHRAIRSILGGAHGHFVPLARPRMPLLSLAHAKSVSGERGENRWNVVVCRS